MVLEFLLISWIVLCVYALLFIYISKNSELYILEIKKLMYYRDLFTFILALLVLFVYLPLIIPRIIYEVFSEK